MGEEKIKALATKALSKLETVKVELPAEAKNTFSFEELWEMKDEEQKFLIPELIPANAVCGLIGEDGIGKTQLLIQLCLHIAMKRRFFMELPLNTICNRCLVVATEDSRQKFTKAIIRQARCLNPELNPKDILINFTEGSNYDDISSLESEMIKLLSANPYDLVVVDAFSDLFTMMDGEINANSDARKLLTMFQNMCNKFSTTIIFIHHAAKTKIVAKRREGKMFLEKFDSQGAGAISQKPRTILGLTHDIKSIDEEGRYFNNYLHVLKANLMGKQYVAHAIKMQFDTHTLLHTDIGVVDISSMETAEIQDPVLTNVRKPMADEVSYETHLSYVDLAFNGSETMSRQDLVKKLKNMYQVGENKINTKGGYLDHLIENGLIVNFNGRFRKGIIDGEPPIIEEAPF